MAVQPFPNPKFRAFDSNGDPLSGGKLYTYAAGTSTPLATYTTRAGTTANANPVVLNANGEADVWTTPGVDYKFELRDSAGVLQWTVDNVPSPADLDTLADGSLRLPDGSAGVPSLAFTNDTDTGLFRVGANNLAVAAGSTKVQDWTAAGTTITGTATVTGAATFSGLATAAGNVALTAANPASTVAHTNKQTPKNLVKAWANITTNGAGGITVQDGFNLTSAVIDSAGLGNTILCTMASAMSGTTYAVVASGGTGPSGAVVGHAVEIFASRSTTVVEFYMYGPTGTLMDPAATGVRLQFMVLGAQ